MWEVDQDTAGRLPHVFYAESTFRRSNNITFNGESCLRSICFSSAAGINGTAGEGYIYQLVLICLFLIFAVHVKSPWKQRKQQHAAELLASLKHLLFLECAGLYFAVFPSCPLLSLFTFSLELAVLFYVGKILVYEVFLCFYSLIKRLQFFNNINFSIPLYKWAKPAYSTCLSGACANLYLRAMEGTARYVD